MPSNKRWVIQFQRSNMTVKCVCKDEITEQFQVLEEVANFIKENPDAQLLEYYQGIYDSDKDEYIKQSNFISNRDNKSVSPNLINIFKEKIFSKKVGYGILAAILVLFFTTAIYAYHRVTNATTPKFQSVDKNNNSKQAQANTIEDRINKLLQNYNENWANAVNSGDFSKVSQYLITGSKFYSSQSELLTKLYNQSVKENFIKCEVSDIKNISEGIYKANVYEEYNVSYPDGSQKKIMDNWVYTIETTPQLGLSDLEQNPNIPSQTKVLVPADTSMGITVTDNVKNIDQKNFSATLAYPSFKGISDISLQNKVNKYFTDLIDQREQNIRQLLTANMNSDVKYSLKTSYLVTYNTNKILSVPFVISTYTGGAHNTIEEVAYNIDLATGDEISLESLFKPDFNYTNVINNEISGQIQANQSKYFPGAFNGIKADQGYYLKGNDLVIFFQPYEIAPFSSGIPEFKIPITIFNNNLNYKL